MHCEISFSVFLLFLFLYFYCSCFLNSTFWHLDFGDKKELNQQYANLVLFNVCLFQLFLCLLFQYMISALCNNCFHMVIRKRVKNWLSFSSCLHQLILFENPELMRDSRLCHCGELVSPIEIQELHFSSSHFALSFIGS